MDRELLRESYIYGEAIKAELGEIRFLTHKEYIMNIHFLSTMSLNVLHIYYQYRNMFIKQKPNKEEMVDIELFLEGFKKQSLYKIVMSDESIANSYYKIFQLAIGDEDSIEKIFDSEELFMQYREIILDMNMVIEDEVSPNPEIQKGIEQSRLLKSSGGEKQTTTDIVTSIVAGTSNSFSDVCNMTVLQVYSIFYRLNAIKTYDTTTLFATVSSDVKIESWSKHIDLFSKETSGIKKKDFDKQYGSLLK